MLSVDDNTRLTRVGPGTPMGRLMREYWMPALLSTELPGPDCSPVRVMLLCERLIAFRDSRGRPALIAEACPHRGASLFFGRNEACGLRCMYHGWKFDADGVCVDAPSEPSASIVTQKVRARAYPCVERGGVVWAYLGPRAVPPPLPDLEPNLEASSGHVNAVLVENNWLQSLEGDVDVAHIPVLHASNLRALAALHDDRPALPLASTFRTCEVSDTAAGFAFATTAASNIEPASRARRARTWSVGHFMFPFFANLPYGALGSHWIVARVPMDDDHTMTIGMWRRGAATPPRELMFGAEPCHLPNTPDWFGRFRLCRNRTNDFGLDRDSARGGGVGIAGQAVQDTAITTSMGPVVDRSREHLGRADVPIIHLRQRLLRALRELDEQGPPAIDAPGAYRTKHGDIRVADGVGWFDALRQHDGTGTPGPRLPAATTS